MMAGGMSIFRNLLVSFGFKGTKEYQQASRNLTKLIILVGFHKTWGYVFSDYNRINEYWIEIIGNDWKNYDLIF